jgi:hypothetical protein
VIDTEWKKDNENNETEDSIKIASEESDPRTQTAKAEIKITFHRPTRMQKNGSIVRRLLSFNKQKNRD